MSIIGPVETADGAGGAPRPPSTRRALWALASVSVLLLVLASVFVATRDGDDEARTSSTTTTTAAATTTTTAAETTTTAPATTTTAPVDTSTAVYPAVTSSVRFTDPVAAARGFAVDFVGFVNPVVGAFQQGDSRSGEVEVRPSKSGPVTTVMVRLFGDTWWVLGAATRDIVLKDPAPMTAISSPVRLRGVSTAFEANVGVEIRQDGARRPVGEGYVMGGAMEELEPFDGTVVFADPTAPMGAIMLYTASMENGYMREATVVRVRFGAPGPLLPSTPCPQYSMRRPAPAAGQMVVTVYYSCDVDGPPVPTYRLAPASSAVLLNALDQLLAGPTAAEVNAGLESWFSPATANMVDSVAIRSGQAVVDFRDLRDVIPNASSSAGSRLLLSQLDATVFQFQSVQSVVYRIEGDCEAFNEWLQYGGCEPRNRTP